MTQIVLDDQINVVRVLAVIQKWAKALALRDARPGEVIKDERAPQILRALNRPTFVTIDADFWNRRWLDRRYCILYFALREDEQGALPQLLRELFRLPEFRTKAARMGRVARISKDRIVFWQIDDDQLHTLPWPRPVV